MLTIIFCLVTQTNKQPPISIGKSHVEIGINEIPLLFVAHVAFEARPIGRAAPHRTIDIAMAQSCDRATVPLMNANVCTI
mmetsp:Transcript_40560/g.73110  ORF Transcript_40560/g.73110 Transcript_40560/m.73110 type:complete len:80 (+) Transcript_40560:57-296(+)